MFLRDDMVDLMGYESLRLRNQAVLAAKIGAFGHQPAHVGRQ